MATYAPPKEINSIWNSTNYDYQESTLTLQNANLLYLAKTGVALDNATLTTFANELDADGIIKFVNATATNRILQDVDTINICNDSGISNISQIKNIGNNLTITDNVNSGQIAFSTLDSSGNAHNKSISSVGISTQNVTLTGLTGATSSMVGLGNCNNTSDANKPISTATQTALNLLAPLANPTFTGTVSGITSSMVGLGNCNNTSDANKPISTATQTALNLLAPLANPTCTGTLTVPYITASGTSTLGTI